MERIAIARAGARHEAAARAARPTSFCLAAEPLYEDPGRGDFSVSNFSSSGPHPRRFGLKRFLAVRRAWRGNGVACF